jgi:catechol 2,3-dioxygenase-like lactoylglutathione lyase family enzyme
MASESLLGPYKIVAFVGVRDAARSRAFYRDLLGLRLVGEDGFALEFDAAGTMLRVSIVPQVIPARYTVLGWEVADIAATAKALANVGVKFELYPGMKQDQLGVWTSPSGSRVAWFKDPDGNTLSISEF